MVHGILRQLLLSAAQLCFTKNVQLNLIKYAPPLCHEDIKLLDWLENGNDFERNDSDKFGEDKKQ
jgi:hypothetical protein